MPPGISFWRLQAAGADNGDAKGIQVEAPVLQVPDINTTNINPLGCEFRGNIRYLTFSVYRVTKIIPVDYIF